MLEQNISIDKLVEVLQRVKSRDGIETITTFELLHILPSDEAVEHSVQADVPYVPVKHPFACPECGRIGQVVCDNTAHR